MDGMKSELIAYCVKKRNQVLRDLSFASYVKGPDEPWMKAQRAYAQELTRWICGLRSMDTSVKANVKAIAYWYTELHNAPAQMSLF